MRSMGQSRPGRPPYAACERGHVGKQHCGARRILRNAEANNVGHLRTIFGACHCCARPR